MKAPNGISEGSKVVLRALGFNSFDSRAEVPQAIGLLNLKIKIVPNGNGTKVFCHGGQAEYDLIKSHLATGSRETEQCEVGGIPYLAMTKDRLESVLRSIAHFRILIAGKARQVKRHQVIANKLAKRWLAQLPRETDLGNVHGATLQEFHSELMA
jgi:hypothetical protein